MAWKEPAPYTSMIGEASLDRDTLKKRCCPGTWVRMKGISQEAWWNEQRCLSQKGAFTVVRG